LISQGVPQLGASNNGEMAKTSLHTYTAVARLPGVSYRLSCHDILPSELPNFSLFVRSIGLSFWLAQVHQH